LKYLLLLVLASVTQSTDTAWIYQAIRIFADQLNNVKAQRA